MTFARFYGYFAAAYGTLWFAVFVAALVTQSSVNIGSFGLFGFPVVALLYAFVRMATTGGSSRGVVELRERIARLEGALDEARGHARGEGEP